MSKSDDSFLEGIGLIILIAIIFGAMNSEPGAPEPDVQPNVQTWQQFVELPPDSDIYAQLFNTQSLIVALGNDVEKLRAQSFDIQYALSVANTQLRIAQQQAEKESKRQRTEQWITTIVGTVAGYLIGKYDPINALKRFFKRESTS